MDLIYNTGVNRNKSPKSFPIFNGKDKIKISIFLVNKFLYSQNKDIEFIWDEEDDKRNIIELLYEKDVEELCLEDSLDEMALRGSMVLKCEASRFQGVLENYMQYDLIVGFTLADEDDNRTYLEPYIFNIIKVEQLSKTTDQNKRYMISFLDILSYCALTHNFASVRKLAASALTSAQNYETLFNTIYDYLISFLQRFTLGSFTYDKVQFLENSEVDTSDLVKTTIDKIPQNASVLDALKIIAYDACTSLYIDKDKLESIKEDFELFENGETALVPFFFKDEYLVHSAAYEAQFQSEDSLKDKMAKFKTNSKDLTSVLLRTMFKRNISMPFYFAFGKDKIIFESLNPDTDKEKENNNSNTLVTKSDEEQEFNCILGQRVSPISSMTTNFMDMTVNNNKWKNMIFIYESQDKGDGNFLLKFDWLFNLYNDVFLGQKFSKEKIITNILPDFYINEKIGLINGSITKEGANKKSASEPAQIATESGIETDSEENSVELTEKDFHEYNSNTFLIRSDNPTKETQYYVGKMLTSFIMLNTSYNYKIEGSLFRRPNEIVKINRHIDQLGATDPNSSAPSGVDAKSKYTMVYVTNVKHMFKSKSYMNIVHANKIYDSYK